MLINALILYVIANFATHVESKGIAAKFGSFAKETREFTITQGMYKNFNTSRCEIMNNCFFQNVHAPYSYVILPPSPDEKNHNINPDENNEAYETSGDMKAYWRIAADEAVVAIGKTPPTMKYFGVNGYIGYKYVKGRFSNSWRSTFGSLGDAINHIRIGEQLGEEPFDQEIAIIMNKSLASVKNYFNLVSADFNVKNRSELVYHCTTHGIVKHPSYFDKSAN
jgi:hypothetical protein